MIPLDVAWGWATRAAAGGSIVLGAGSVAVALGRAPVWRARWAAWTLAGAGLVPVLGLVPAVPRWSLVPAPAVEIARVEPSAPRPTSPPTPFRDPEPDTARTRDRPEPTPAPATPAAPVDPRAVALAAWGLIGLGWVAWWGLGMVLLARTCRGAWPVEGRARAELDAIAGPAAARVRLLASPRVARPITCTHRRATILLPAALADGADPRELRFVLAHEWSHVERHDFRTWTLGTLAGAIWAVHPLYWFVRRQLRLNQDFLADDRASGVESPAEFAAFLVRLARARRDRAGFPLPALGIGGRPSHLTRRVLMLLRDRPPLARRCRPVATATAGSLATLVLLLAAGVRLDAAPQTDKPQGQAAGPSATVEVGSRAPFVFIPMPQQSPPTQQPGSPLDVNIHGFKYPAPPELLVAAGGREWSGQIIDRLTGQPIAGTQVRVNLSSSRGGNSPPSRDIRATTPADGSYRFILTAEEQADPTLFITLDVDHPDHIRYSGGYGYALMLRNILLGERPFFEKPRLFPAAPIEGLVLAPDGTPAAGVKVQGYAERNIPREGNEFGQFCDTRTDERGRFRLPIHPEGKAIFTLIPERFAPELHIVPGNRRGDLGTFRLGRGFKLAGRVLDAGGRPMGGVYVTATHDPTELRADPAMPEQVSDAVVRSGLTGADGSFALPPLPVGTYDVQPTADDWDPLTRELPGHPPHRPLPGVFVGAKVTLGVGPEAEPVTFRALPQVTVAAQVTDSRGAKHGGFEVRLRGTLGGREWSAPYEPSVDGQYTMIAPRGLEDAAFELESTEDSTFRRRVTKDAPLAWDQTVRLGMLDRDVSGIEIIHYVSPVVLIKATTATGRPVPGLKPAVDVVAQIAQGGGFIREGGDTSDVLVEGPQEDGRFRTISMAPDTEYEVSVKADGYATQTRRIKLPEGKTEEVTFVLERQ